jgi:hypothetical protein
VCEKGVGLLFHGERVIGRDIVEEGHHQPHPILPQNLPPPTIAQVTSPSRSMVPSVK